MDPRIQLLIRRLQVGPFDTTAFSRIHRELDDHRAAIAAAGDHETFVRIIELIDKWSETTRDQSAASMAQFEAASLCEVELEDTESAVQRYTLSLELNPGNVESFHRLVSVLQNQGDFERLETILNQQAIALADFDSVEPAFRVEVLREIAKAGAEKNRNLDGAIQALEEVVNLEPDLSDVKELARLRSVRGQAGDLERAADLFYTAGDVLGALEGMEMVSKALDSNPAHEEALNLLEQWTPQQEHPSKLKYRWAAYLEKGPSGSAADERRRKLAQAYGESNEFQKGLDCIAPLFERGDAEAKEIHIKLRAGLEVAKPAPRAPQPSSLEQPQIASGKPFPRRMKRTMVGYKVDTPTGERGVSATAPKPFTPPAPQQPVVPTAPKQPFAPAASRAQQIPQQPLAQNPEPSPPKPPAVAAAPVPASALLRPNAGRVPAVIQEHSGSYLQVDVASQPPGATSEPPVPISIPPEQMFKSSDTTIEYELKLRKRSRSPFFIAAAVVLLSATGFAAYRFTSSESSQDAPEQASTEPVVPPKPEQEKKPDPSAEAQQPQVGEETPTETAQPPEKSAAIAQKAQAEEPSKRKPKAKKAKKKSGPVVELVTKRARFKRGRVNKKNVFALLEKNLPKIERCYARALKRKRRLKGRVFFAWTIKKSGYVYGAKRIQGRIKDKKMINCVRRVLNKIRYKKPKRKSARVIIPFDFRRSE